MSVQVQGSASDVNPHDGQTPEQEVLSPRT